MQSERPDEDARRAYWTEQLEAACGHLAAVSDYPVDECGQAMAPLPVRRTQLTVNADVSHGVSLSRPDPAGWMLPPFPRRDPPTGLLRKGVCGGLARACPGR